jgi:large subunit ribosomal protein L10
MKTADKKHIVSELKKVLDSSTVTILADYKGMTVKDVTALKKRLKSVSAKFLVAKNTLTNKAVESDKKLNELKTHLSGPTAIIIGTKDPVEPIKVLTKFISENEKPKIKVGVFDGRIATAQEISAISKLPPRQELLAKVAGGMKAPITGLVFVLSGNLRKLVYALSAIKDKKSQ